MKVEKTLLSTVQNRDQQQLQNRKSLLWTKEKISQLIELYKKHECLWNHWHESYKNKNKRNQAIHDICTTLRITKFEFGKKIHNLRNQFNTEMKKLEQRIEEAGASLAEATASDLGCKWSHFESLMFLRRVIEPRPFGYQSSLQTAKKKRLDFDINNTDNAINIPPLLSNNNSGFGNNSANTVNPEEQFPYDDNDTDDVIADDFQSFDNDVVEVSQQASRQEVYDRKYQPPPQQTANQGHSVTASENFKNNSKKLKSFPACSSSSSQTEIINVNDDASILELNSNLTVVPAHTLITTTAASSSSPTISTPVTASVTSGSFINRQTSGPRDQWDAFGELVANEFRNLNSEHSRKRLKRKIMQAMLEIGEEDDTLTANCNRNN